MCRARLAVVSAVILSMLICMPSFASRLACWPFTQSKSDVEVKIAAARKAAQRDIRSLKTAQTNLTRYRFDVYEILERLPSSLVHLPYSTLDDAHLLREAVEQMVSIASNTHFADASMRLDAYEGMTALISNGELIRKWIHYDLNHTAPESLRLTHLLTPIFESFASAVWEQERTMPNTLLEQAIRGLGSFSYPWVHIIENMGSVAPGVPSTTYREDALNRLRQLALNKKKMEDKRLHLHVTENIALFSSVTRRLTPLSTREDIDRALQNAK